MLEFCDSFDHYSNTELPYKWSGGDTSGGFGIDAGRGRFGTKGYYASSNRYLYKTGMGAKAERWIGFAWQPQDGFGGRDLVTLTDALTGQVDIRLVSGVVTGNRTTGGVLLGTGSTVISTGIWYYVELHVVIDNSAGVLELRIDGNVEFALTSQDTQSTANATFDGLYFNYIGGGGGGGQYIDDVYVIDNVDSGVGGVPNDDFLGDVRVEARLPSGNGNSSQLDGSDGNSTDNYLLVDETSPDGDTTYVESPDVGDKDTYAFQDVTPITGTVYGVQVLSWARKTSAGTRAIASVARLAATEDDSANHTLSSSYQYLYDMREEKPGTGAWSITDVNSAEFGVKVSV